MTLDTSDGVWLNDMIQQHGLDVAAMISGDMDSLGISAKVKFEDVNKILITFRSLGDMNLYKLFGKFKSNQPLNIQFRYGRLAWMMA